MKSARFGILLIPLVVVLAMAALLIPRGGASPALAGTILTGHSAPVFRLQDQWGKSVSLTQFRGRPVVLTFLEAHCTQKCPLVANKIRSAVSDVVKSGGAVATLVISTDPEGD